VKDSKLDQVLEGYKPIPMKRLFYPRGMKLSEEFINAFHREYDRLISEGLNPKTLVERVSKAMTFHINDPRKYKLLDEEKAKSEETKNPTPVPPRKKGKDLPVVEGGMSAHRPKTDAPGKASSNYTKPKEKAKDKKPEGQKQREHEEGQSGNKQTGY
jgi:hypothetical protein|tara:strand:- start:36 stop:506 length:471 start_codon:yes stop_codon:yes gene_type:complete